MTTETGLPGAGYPANAESLEAFLEEKIRAEGVPGLSVAVIQGRHTAWKRGFGLADVATSTPATPQTSYLWFSMTKIATATAVVRLAEEGKLDLDSPADEYYRGFKVVSQPAPVTLRHLLSHSSGLANPMPIRWVYPASGPVPDRRAFVEHLGGGAGFWNVMRIYPEESLGVVMMGNTTSYDHETILEAILRTDWAP
ncbi:hypothetical protein BH18ACT11_BH18ACT11_20650 [soil metagenome]